jgi:hypothetical protein
MREGKKKAEGIAPKEQKAISTGIYRSSPPSTRRFTLRTSSTATSSPCSATLACQTYAGTIYATAAQPCYSHAVPTLPTSGSCSATLRCSSP